MKPSIVINGAGGEASVTLNGAWVVKNASDMHRELTSIPDTNIRFLLAGVTVIDLSFVQVMLAFVRDRRSKGFDVSIDGSIEDADLQLLVKTGFGPLFKNYFKSRILDHE